jgi:xanthine/CO dehydrogenase XdhC/CoxF family maturation factor
MDSSVQELSETVRQARQSGTPLVLGTIVATRGSTYRKVGAQIVISPEGQCTGLLSGGCLEADIAHRAVDVFKTGQARLVTYDNRGDDDSILWGLGSGCVGGMDVLLTSLDPMRDWHPMSALMDATERRIPTVWTAVTASVDATVPLGTFLLSQGPGEIIGMPAGIPDVTRGWLEERVRPGPTATIPVVSELASLRVLTARLVFPPSVLLVGAGADAVPVARFGTALGWRVVMTDHRPSYIEHARRSGTGSVIESRLDGLKNRLDLAAFDAAVVMTHQHLSDLEALQLLSAAPIDFIGLLGPAARRQRLLEELDEGLRNALRSRLHAPVGLNLGGRTPASIALSIVAELQSHFAGRTAGDVHWDTGRGH